MEKTYLIMFNSKAWHAHEDILVDDYLIKCHKAIDYGADGGYRGARYKVAFSRRFPHFEVRLIPVTLVFNSQINLSFQTVTSKGLCHGSLVHFV